MRHFTYFPLSGGIDRAGQEGVSSYSSSSSFFFFFFAIRQGWIAAVEICIESE